MPFLKKGEKHTVRETFELHYFVWMETYTDKEKKHISMKICLEAGLNCPPLVLFLTD